MGLDATVRCTCFEEGKLKPGPVPMEDLYVDEEGYVSSKKLTRAYKELDYRRFRARYHELEWEFEDWHMHCCEHEDMDYCHEWVSNWAGCAEFRSLVDEVGGEQEFPLLSALLPDCNGGTYPAEKAEATLAELDRFIKKISTIDEWVLCDLETDDEIWSSTDGATFTWRYGPNDRVGMCGGKVFFIHGDDPLVETTHFKQIPVGKPDQNGNQKMRIVCLDSDAVTETFDSLGPVGAPKVEREFHVVSRQAPFLYEGKYWTAERIRNLLVASLETGNPIRWC